MKSSVTCAIVKDLLPNYLEGLTSEETNASLEAHVKECPECAALLERMREPGPDGKEGFEEKAEIDFLKKTRKRNRRTLIVIAVFAALVFMAAETIPIFAPRELSYHEVETELFVSDVLVDNANVENGLISMTVRANSENCIRKVDFSEKDGVVTVTVAGAKDSIFSKPVYEAKYNAGHTIKAIRFGGNTIWAEGVAVSDDTLRAYKTAHPYMGNAPQNGKTLSALGVYENLGAYKMKLKTDAEPYGMILNLEKPIEKKKEAYAENYMGFVAYNCLALIDNLSSVTFQYQSDGENREETWDMERAKAELGKDVKEYGKSEVMLESLKWDYYK